MVGSSLADRITHIAASSDSSSAKRADNPGSCRASRRTADPRHIYSQVVIENSSTCLFRLIRDDLSGPTPSLCKYKYSALFALSLCAWRLAVFAMRLSFPSVEPTFKRDPRSCVVDRVLDSPVRRKRRVVAFKASFSKIVRTFVSYAAFANRVETPRVPAIERKESSQHTETASVSRHSDRIVEFLVGRSMVHHRGSASLQREQITQG